MNDDETNEDDDLPLCGWADAVALVLEDLHSVIDRNRGLGMTGHASLSSRIAPEMAAARVSVAIDVLTRLEAAMRKESALTHPDVMRTVDVKELRERLKRELPRHHKGFLCHYTADEVAKAIERAIEAQRPAGCTCKGGDEPAHSAARRLR